MPPSSTAWVVLVFFPTSCDVGYKYTTVFDGFSMRNTYNGRAAVFDGLGGIAFLPTSCDVGYKYTTVFDGFSTCNRRNFICSRTKKGLENIQAFFK
jgi:hypothetical protein